MLSCLAVIGLDTAELVIYIHDVTVKNAKVCREQMGYPLSQDVLMTNVLMGETM